jgi:hypothetical protein
VAVTNMQRSAQSQADEAPVHYDLTSPISSDDEELADTNELADELANLTANNVREAAAQEVSLQTQISPRESEEVMPMLAEKAAPVQDRLDSATRCRDKQNRGGATVQGQPPPPSGGSSCSTASDLQSWMDDASQYGTGKSGGRLVSGSSPASDLQNLFFGDGTYTLSRSEGQFFVNGSDQLYESYTVDSATQNGDMQNQGGAAVGGQPLPPSKEVTPMLAEKAAQVQEVSPAAIPGAVLELLHGKHGGSACEVCDTPFQTCTANRTNRTRKREQRQFQFFRVILSDSDDRQSYLWCTLA